MSAKDPKSNASLHPGKELSTPPYAYQRMQGSSGSVSTKSTSSLDKKYPDLRNLVLR